MAKPEEKLTYDDLVERYSSPDKWERLESREASTPEARDFIVQRDRRRVLVQSEDLGPEVDRRVREVLEMSPGVSPQTMVPLVTEDYEPYRDVLQDLLMLDEEVSAETIGQQASEAGSPTAQKKGGFAESGFAHTLTGITRNALIGLSLPWELAIGTARSVYGQAREGDWAGALGMYASGLVPGIEGAVLPEGEVGPWEQTHFYQSYLNQDAPDEAAQGSGWFPNVEFGAGKAQREAAIAAAGPVRGLDEAWTFGRGASEALGWDPDSNRYRLVSGMIDFGFALLDPLVVAGKVGKVARASARAAKVREQAAAGAAERAQSTAGVRAGEQVEATRAAKEAEITEIEKQMVEAEEELGRVRGTLTEEIQEARRLNDEWNVYDQQAAERLGQTVNADEIRQAQDRLAVLRKAREERLRERESMLAQVGETPEYGGPTPRQFRSESGTIYSETPDGWERRRTQSRESETMVGVEATGPVTIPPRKNTVFLSEDDANAVQRAWDVRQEALSLGRTVDVPVVLTKGGKLVGRFYDDSNIEPQRWVEYVDDNMVARRRREGGIIREDGDTWDEAFERAGGVIEERVIDDMARDPEVGRLTVEWDDVDHFHFGSKIEEVTDTRKGILPEFVDESINYLIDYAGYPGVVVRNTPNNPGVFEASDAVMVGIENGDVVAVRLPKVYDSVPEKERALGAALSRRLDQLQEPDSVVTIEGQVYYKLDDYGVYSQNMWTPDEGQSLSGMAFPASFGTGNDIGKRSVFIPEEYSDDIASTQAKLREQYPDAPAEDHLGQMYVYEQGDQWNQYRWDEITTRWVQQYADDAMANEYPVPTLDEVLEQVKDTLVYDQAWVEAGGAVRLVDVRTIDAFDATVPQVGDIAWTVRDNRIFGGKVEGVEPHYGMLTNEAGEVVATRTLLTESGMSISVNRSGSVVVRSAAQRGAAGTQYDQIRYVADPDARSLADQHGALDAVPTTDRALRPSSDAQAVGRHAFVFNVDDANATYLGKVEGTGEVVEFDLTPDTFRIEAFDSAGNKLELGDGAEFMDVSHRRLAHLTEGAAFADRPAFDIGGVSTGRQSTRIAYWKAARLDKDGNVIPDSVSNIPGKHVDLDVDPDASIETVRNALAQPEALLSDKPVNVTRSLNAEDTIGRPALRNMIAFLSAGVRRLGRDTDSALNELSELAGSNRAEQITWNNVLETVSRSDELLEVFRQYLHSEGVLALDNLGRTPDSRVSWLTSKLSGSSVTIPAGASSVPVPPMTRAGREAVDALDSDVARIDADLAADERVVSSMTQAQQEAIELARTASEARIRARNAQAGVDDLSAELADMERRVAEGKELSKKNIAALREVVKRLVLPDDAGLASRKYDVKDTVALMEMPSWIGATGNRIVDRLLGRLGTENIIPTIAKEKNLSRLNEWFQGYVPNHILKQMAESENPETVASLIREILAGRGDIFEAMAKSSRSYFTEYAPRMPLTPMVAKALLKTKQGERARRAGDVRAKETTWVDVRNETAGATVLRRWLTTVGLHGERSDKLVHTFLKAETPEERSDILMNVVVNGVRDAILDEAGVDIASDFGQAIHEATRMFDAGNVRAMRKYYQDKIGHGASTHSVTVNGETFQFMSPHLEIELLDSGALLPSAAEIRALNTKFGRMGRKVVDGKIQMGPTALASHWISRFTEAWRSLQLIRGAYVLRNIGETQYRSYLYGHHNWMTDPLMYLGMVTGVMGSKAGTRAHRIFQKFDRYNQMAPGITAKEMSAARGGGAIDDFIDENGQVIDSFMEEYINVVSMASPNDYRPLAYAENGYTKEWVSRADGEKFQRAHARELIMLNLDPLARAVANPEAVIKQAGLDVPYASLDKTQIQERLLDIIMDENGPYRQTLDTRYSSAPRRERQGWYERDFVRQYLFEWEGTGGDISLARRIEEATGGNNDLRAFVGSSDKVLFNSAENRVIGQIDVRDGLRKAALEQQGPVRTKQRNAALEAVDAELGTMIRNANMDSSLADDQVFLWMIPKKAEGPQGNVVGNWFFAAAGDTEKLMAWSPEFRTNFVRTGLELIDNLHPEDALAWIDFVEGSLPKLKRTANPLPGRRLLDIKEPLKRERARQMKRLDDTAPEMKGKNRRGIIDEDDPETMPPTWFVHRSDLEGLDEALVNGTLDVVDGRVRVSKVDMETGEITEKWVKAHYEPRAGSRGLYPTSDGWQATKAMGDHDITAWRRKDTMAGYLTIEDVKQIAAHESTRHVNELYYHALSTNNFWHAARMLIPFGAPTTSGYKSFAKSTLDWTRLATRHYPALKTFTSLQKEGSSIINETLDSIEPGTTPGYSDNPNTDDDAPNRPFLYRDREDGPLRARIPLVGSLMGGVTDLLGITEDARNQELGFNLSGANLLYQGAQPLPENASLGEQAAYQFVNAVPGPGPFIQSTAAMAPFITEGYDPGRNILNQWIWPYGRPSDMTDIGTGLMPAYARYGLAAIMPTGYTSQQWRARDERGLLSYHAARNTGVDWQSAEGRQELQARVRRDASALGVLRAIGGFFLPAMPRWDYSVEDMNDEMLIQSYVAEEWSQIRDMAPDYDTAVVGFMDRFGEDLLPMLVPTTTGTMDTPTLQAFNQMVRNPGLEQFREVINYFYPGDRDWIAYEWGLRKQYRRTLTLDERMTEAARYVADQQKAQISRRSILQDWGDTRVETEERQWNERWEGVPGVRGRQQFLSVDDRILQVRRALEEVPELRQSKPGVLALEAFARMDYYESITEYSLSAKSSADKRARFHAEVYDIFGDEPEGQEMRRLFLRATEGDE